MKLRNAATRWIRAANHVSAPATFLDRAPPASARLSSARTTGVRFFTDETQNRPTPPVVRPSITWGIIGDKEAQREGREKVLEYLKSEGINTEEFESVELPTTVDVMAERVEFIKNLGLERQHINEYPLIVCCSVKKNMVPVINYLEAIGLTTHDLRLLFRKYPMVLHSSVTIDIQPVIIYLMGLGLPRAGIPKVLVRYPEMLGYRLEGTMSTSIAYLVSIGVHIRSIGGIVMRAPEVLGMRVGNSIKPRVDYLCGLGMAREAVGKLLQHNISLLKIDFEAMKERVERLTKAGVSPDGMPGMILQYPSVLCMPIDKRIQRQTEWMQKELKISNQDFGRVLEKMPQVLGLSQPFAMLRVKFLSSKGFQLSDIGKMVMSCPQILVQDLRGMKESLEYFEKTMKREKKELIEFPAYFSYGLEERIRFRYKRVAERNLNFRLAWFLNCSNAVFQQRIGGPIMEEPGRPTETQFVFGGAVKQLRMPEAGEAQDDDSAGDDDEEGNAVGFL